jgi:hypothetical protein
MATLAGAGTALWFDVVIETLPALTAGEVKLNCNSTAVPPVTVAEDGVTDANAGGAGGFTATVTVLVTPPQLSETVTAVDAVTTLVGMLKVPELCPAVTPTVVAAIALWFELPIVIVVPAAAGPVKPNCKEAAAPPMTVEDAGVTEASAGGFTVRPAGRVTPLYATEMVRFATAATACVATLKLPPVDVAVSAILAGVIVTDASEHVMDTEAAPDPAAPDSANVP